MTTETNSTAAINRYTNFIVLTGIILLWVIGIVHLFDDQVGLGVGLIITSVILLRLFVWIEKSKN